MEPEGTEFDNRPGDAEQDTHTGGPAEETAAVAPLETTAPGAEFAPAPPPAPASQAVAPAWHTVVLVVGILTMAIRSAVRFPIEHTASNRLPSYAMTGFMELVLVAWVMFGLRLRRVPLRSILGGFSFHPMALLKDAGVALVFWFASLFVLGSLGVAWSGFERALRHEPAQTSLPSSAQQPQAGKPLAPSPFQPDPAQRESLRTLKLLAPEGASEMFAWALLCLVVGFCEELVFRGYLQRQCIALARGNVLAGIAMSAAVFGSAHAYQGGRNMVLLAVFGAMFGMLALLRRSLRAGMMAHSWHDLCAGLVLALLRSSHLI